MTDELDSSEWICDPCLIEKHNFCHITSSMSNCKCPVCYSRNMKESKKSLQDKYQKITGVSID